jgi:hypothetical protein
VDSQQYRYISRGLVGLVFCFALLSSALLISGDQYGKVNLLYLLLLFVAWPLLSLVISISSVFAGSKKSGAAALLSLPIWPNAWQSTINDLKRSKSYPLWLFSQGQKLALTFSVASLIAFLFVLLFNDVTFVWRSTLLSAEQLFPMLKALAKPWFFYESAQPLAEMVRAAQDSRLSTGNISQLSAASSWWLYVLMSQIFYAIIPRTGLFYWGRFRLSQHIANAEKETVSARFMDQKINQQSESLKEVVELADPLQEYVLLSATVLPKSLKQHMYQQIGKPKFEYVLSGQENDDSEEKAILDNCKKVLVVAAWEPPLGELADFMALTQGIIIPVDWKGEQFCQISELHLDEWRRFCFPMKQWQLQLMEIDQ